MNNNEMKLKKLMNEIDRKANRKLSKIITNTALKYGMSFKDVEEKHKELIEKTKEKLLTEETNIHKEEIDSIKSAMCDNMVEEYKKKPKPRPVAQPFKKEKNIKGDFGFTKEEIDFMKSEYFYNNKGYRAIATILEKDEIKVRKQIAQLMSELVA
mgnify:CR=1 FL=1